MEEKPIIENKIKALELELDNVKKRIDRLEPTKQDNRSKQLEDWENDNITCKSAGLKIALNDYYEVGEDGDKKTEFTFDEVKDLNIDGWRLPTAKEWTQIYSEFGFDNNDKPDRDVFAKTLMLTEYENCYGGYWSSTASSSSFAYRLYFDSSYVSPANNNHRNNGYSVRLVKDMAYSLPE